MTECGNRGKRKGRFPPFPQLEPAIPTSLRPRLAGGGHFLRCARSESSTYCSSTPAGSNLRAPRNYPPRAAPGLERDENCGLGNRERHDSHIPTAPATGVYLSRTLTRGTDGSEGLAESMKVAEATGTLAGMGLCDGVSRPQTRSVLSSLPETARRPSGVTATALIPSVCPSRMRE